jgi:carbon-monoxide dehydrogenase medium subunit
MHTAPFRYVRPTSLDDAAKAFAASADAKFLAGGQSLIPAMKLRLAAPQTLIDLARVEGLRFIRAESTALVVGAGTTHAEVASSAAVKKAIPALAQLAGEIGDPAVRHRGTLGGSIANNDPSADYPAAALALGATITTTKRKIAADDFFTGMFSTALEDGETVKEVSFPVPRRAGYARFPNPASRFAMVGVFVAEFANGVRVAVTGAGPCVFRVPEMENALSKSFAPDAIARIRVAPDDLTSDIHASAEYRAHLVTVMAKRAVAAAMV